VAASRLRILVAALALSLLITTGLSILASNQRQVAEHNLAHVEAQRLASAAQIELGHDPTSALLLAAEASARQPIQISYDTLRAALDVPARTQITLGGYHASAYRAAYSPRIVTPSDDATTIIWDATSGQKLMALAGHTDAVNSADYSPDGAHIVTASDDTTAIIWDATSGQQLMTLAGHTDAVNSAAYSPDGARIVTAFQRYHRDRLGCCQGTAAENPGRPYRHDQ
jgi:hypothetical protein